MKKIILFLGLLLIALAAFAAFFVPSAWLSRPEDNAPAVTVEITEGMKASDVAALLVQKGLIQSLLGYKIYGLLDRAADKPRAGSYTLKSGMSYRQIARAMALGPAKEEIQIKVIEGWSNDALGLELSKYSISTPDWLEQVGSFKNGKPMAEIWRRDFPFLKDLPKNASLEGYLFPDTYRVYKDQLPQGLITKQLEEFEKRAANIVGEAKKQGRTLQEVVTLASIVEKEVAKPEDRKIVAGIFLNRLTTGMKLQSDATVSYLTNSGKARATLEETELDSPFNTYKYKGLPPGPICNPGDDALQAALHPAETDYLYFLTDDQGKTYYAKTLEEHKENREKAFGG